MAKLYTKNTPDWADEILSTDERYDILTDAGAAINSNVQINLISTVAQAGTAVDATRMNNIEDGLDAVDTLLDEVNTELIAARGGSADLDTRLDSLVQTQIAAASTDDTPADADVFGYLVAGVLKKFTWANIKAALKTYFDTLYRPVSEVDGWIAAGETWVYVSAGVYKIVGVDLTAKYTTGTKVKLTQTTVKYFNVASSALNGSDTEVTVQGGSDYSLANAAITSPYYSRASLPSGFPQWFNFAPTHGGFSADPTGAYRFSVVGRLCTYVVRNSANGTSNATSYTITAPFTAAAIANCNWGAACMFVVDGGTTQTAPARATIDQNSNVVTITKNMAGNAWTNSGGKRANFTLQFEI